MLGVIILHESVIWKGLCYERDKRCLKNVKVEFSIHDAVKDADLRGRVSADSSPDMDFEWVLGLGLSLCRFANLLVTGAPVLFKGDGTFIAENDVVETVTILHDLPGVLEPFNLVGVSYQLAISSTLQGPSLLFP